MKKWRAAQRSPTLFAQIYCYEKISTNCLKRFVIAESKSANFRFFCECKTAAIKTNEVFVLAGKMADTGCSKGYIFTLDKDTPKEIRHLGRSRNISIVGEALGRTEESLLTEIRDE